MVEGMIGRMGGGEAERMGRLAEGKTVEHETMPAVRQMRTWHKSLARAAVTGGRRPGELGKIFGLTPSHVSRLLASPLIIAEMNRLEALAELELVDMQTELKLRQGRALEVVDETLKAETEGDLPLKRQEDMALEILDRTGYGKIGKGVQVHKVEPLEELVEEELDKRIAAKMRALGLEEEEEVIDLQEGAEGSYGAGS